MMARASGSLMCVVLHCIFIDTACAALLATKALTVTAVYRSLLAQKSLHAATKKTFFN